MASSSSLAPTSWAILGMIPRTCAADAELPQGSDVFLKLASPPRVSLLDISPRICKRDITGLNFPSVLAADPSGLLLLHVSDGLVSSSVTVYKPDHMRFLSQTFLNNFYICHPDSGTASQLPSPPDIIIDVGNLGLLVMPGNRASYIVAELQPIVGSNYAGLLFFSSESGTWQHKPLVYKLPPRPWGSHRVLSHNQKLWWVDVSWGLLTCDPSDKNPVLSFVPLPKVLDFNPEWKDLEKRRCVQLSEDQIVFVEISEGIPIRPSVFVHRLRQVKLRRRNRKVCYVRVWILVDPISGEWKLKRNVSLDSNFFGDTFIGSGLIVHKPRLALIHPTNQDEIFFFAGESLVSINLGTKKIEQWGDHQMIAPPSNFLSSRFVHAWQLTPTFSSNLSNGLLPSDAGSGSNGEMSAPPTSDSIIYAPGSAKETEDGANEGLQQLHLLDENED